MQRLVLVFLFCLLTSAANSQQVIQLEKTVSCGTLKFIVEQLSGTYGEEPNWNGLGQNSKYVMFVNPKTNTWTIIEYNDNVACILGAGERSTLLRFGKSV